MARILLVDDDDSLPTALRLAPVRLGPAAIAARKGGESAALAVCNPPQSARRHLQSRKNP